ncbi:hypothetical protein BX616_003690, partial [Lobosporangium transversale]
KKVEPEKPTPVPVPEQTRDPTRSIYYDPILNPYGAPPPGQPYLEYPPLPSQHPMGMEEAHGKLDQQEQSQESEEESDSGSSSDSSSDSDSDSSTSESDSEDPDDEKFMPPLPEGPAPSKEEQTKFLELTKPKVVVVPQIHQHPSLQWPPMQPRPEMYPPGFSHPGVQNTPMSPMNPIDPPIGIHPQYGSVYPPTRPGLGPPPPMGYGHPPMHTGPGMGPPPPGYGAPGPYGGPNTANGPGGYMPPGFQARPSYPRPMRPPSQRPPPPRYIKPPRTTDPQNDPMTGHLPPDEKEKKRIKEQAEAAAAAASTQESSPVSVPTKPGLSTATGTISHPLPPKPSAISATPKPTLVAGPASISAEPQLRNLQKELVHLVPSTIMRKRVSQKGKIGKPVNAAPGVDEDDYNPVSGESAESASAFSSLTTVTVNTGMTEAAGSEPEYRETGLGLRLPKINAAPSVPSLLSPRKIVVNTAPEVPVAVDRAAKKKAEYDEFLQGLEGAGLL